MKKSYLELFKNTGILTVANFSSKILVFLLVPLYTSVLTTGEYGLTDLIFSSVQLAVPVFTLNIADAVLRYTIEADKDTDSVFCVSIKYTVISLVPCFILLVMVSYLGAYDTKQIHWFYIAVYYIFYSFNQCLPAFAKGVEKVKETAISGVISTVVNVFSCVLFLLVLKKGVQGFFISNILGQFAPVVYLLTKVNTISRFKKYRMIDKALEKSMLLYSIPLIFTNVGWWINNTSDRYIITYFYDVELNGLLSVAYKIPSILSILAGIFIQAWQISAMKEFEKIDSKDFYNNVYVYLNVFLYFVTWGLILLTKPLAYIAFQKDFYDAWIFVPFLLLSVVFTANAGFFSPIITSSYNTKDVALSTVYGAIANVVLNILLLKCIGAQGVAVATAISSFIIMGYRFWVLRGTIDARLFFKTGILWGLLAVQCIGEIVEVFWFAELLPMVIAFIFFRCEILGLVNKGFKIVIERKNKK